VEVVTIYNEELIVQIKNRWVGVHRATLRKVTVTSVPFYFCDGKPHPFITRYEDTSRYYDPKDSKDVRSSFTLVVGW
jgi:hypothetical protein